jgi:DNA repair ATPase RecN
VTTRVRIDAVVLDTTEGTVRYAFPSDLTVLAGPTGVGKTTLLELIKYGLGCDGKRAAARTGASSNAGARISFADVYSFLYVAQADINHDIAHSQESYRDPKRKAVFELLFGLTHPGILKMQSDLNTLNGTVAVAEAEHETVLAFLRDSGTASRADTETRQLADQLAEMDSQLQAIAGQLAAAARAVADRAQLVKNLSADLDARTAARITRGDSSLHRRRAAPGNSTRPPAAAGTCTAPVGPRRRHRRSRRTVARRTGEGALGAR